MEKFENVILKSIANAAKFVAIKSPDSLSGFFDYEPRIPQELISSVSLQEMTTIVANSDEL